MKLAKAVIEDVKKALFELGVKGHVAIVRCDSLTVSVRVNNIPFGKWDISRKTFVD